MMTGLKSARRLMDSRDWKYSGFLPGNPFRENNDGLNKIECQNKQA